jgi:hypothetical protein
MNMERKGPLARFKVLDLTRARRADGSATRRRARVQSHLEYARIALPAPPPVGLKPQVIWFGLSAAPLPSMPTPDVQVRTPMLVCDWAYALGAASAAPIRTQIAD